MRLNFSNFDDEHIDIIVSSGKHQQKFWVGDKSLGAKVVWQWVIGASLSELQGSDVYCDFV